MSGKDEVGLEIRPHARLRVGGGDPQMFERRVVAPARLLAHLAAQRGRLPASAGAGHGERATRPSDG